MTTGRKSEAMRSLEAINGGPLTLPQLLEAIRLGEEETQTAFARKLGITRAKLCDIEKGRRSPTLAQAAAWAKVLGYSPTQFVRYALQDMVRDEGLKYTVSVAS